MSMDSYDWQDYLCLEQRPGACILVIFGASGDLAKRKLFPSLYALYTRGLLDRRTRIVGAARHPYSDESFREELQKAFPSVPPAELAGFLSKISYLQVDYGSGESCAELGKSLDALDADLPRLYYLALPPNVYPAIAANLSSAGLLAEKNAQAWRHAVFEKPFGTDLKSAAALKQTLRRYLKEEQIYRIDHYLGKETVQNIFLLRFANRIFEPIWNAEHIDSVQITVAETLGVENRAGYFDQTGILRDMFQNHMLEMLSLAAMECPEEFSADRVRDEKLKLIRAIRPVDLENPGRDTIRAQYAGYREERGIRPDSTTETFAAMRIFIDNPRWKGVPFYLRAGKKMAGKKSEIDIVFKSVPRSIFPKIKAGDLQQDVLHLRVQPEEGIGLTIQAKKPGPKLCMGALTLNYDYRESGGVALDAYARLLLDCQLGDQTLFIRSDIIKASWTFFQPLLDCWRAGKTPLYSYPCGADGPEEAAKLPAADGRHWL